MSSACHILTLPAEIRLRIYEDVLRSDLYLGRHYDSCFPAIRGHRECSLVRNHAGGKLKRNTPPCKLAVSASQCRVLYNHYELDEGQPIPADTSQPLRSVALLRVCRTFYQEAVDVLYSSTLFIVDLQAATREKSHHPAFLNSVKLGSPLPDAAFLRRIRHLNLRVQVFDLDDLVGLTGLLQEFLSRLSKERESLVLTLDLHKAGRVCMSPDQERLWQDLVAAVKIANLPSEIVLSAQSEAIRPSMEQHAEDLNGRLRWRKCSRVYEEVEVKV